MCGIVGIAGSITDKKHTEFFQTLHHLSSLRGLDSSGIACIDRKHRYNIHKWVGPADLYFEGKRYETINSTGEAVILGHNRKATYGKINTENAHPFYHNQILGCHNGHIHYNQRNVLVKGLDFDTDSEALIYALSLLAEEKKDFFSFELTGAWSLVWYNFRNATLHFARNPERPLSFSFTKDNKLLAWASDPTFLRFAANRHDVDLDKIYHLADNTMATFSVPKLHEIFKQPTLTRLPGFMTPAEKKAKEEEALLLHARRKQHWHSNYNPHIPDKDNDNVLIMKAPVEDNTTPDFLNRITPGTKGNKSFTGPNNLPVTYTEFFNKTRCSCAMCSSIVTADSNYRWLNDDEILCEDCIETCRKDINENNSITQIVRDAFPTFLQSLKAPSSLVPIVS